MAAMWEAQLALATASAKGAHFHSDAVSLRGKPASVFQITGKYNAYDHLVVSVFTMPGARKELVAKKTACMLEQWSRGIGAASHLARCLKAQGRVLGEEQLRQVGKPVVAYCMRKKRHYRDGDEQIFSAVCRCKPPTKGCSLTSAVAGMQHTPGWDHSLATAAGTVLHRSFKRPSYILQMHESTQAHLSD